MNMRRLSHFSRLTVGISLLALMLSAESIAQQSPDVLVIGVKDIEILPDAHRIGDIVIKSQPFKRRTEAQLMTMAIDSTLLYGGNCLKITHLAKDDRAGVFWNNADLFQGSIYRIEPSERERITVYMRAKSVARDSALTYGRTAASIEAEVGIMFGRWDDPVRPSGGAIGNSGGTAFYSDFHLNVLKVIHPARSKAVQFRIGLGLSDVYADWFPEVSLAELGIPDQRDLRVERVRHAAWHIGIPVSISYDVRALMQHGSALRISAGLQPRAALANVRVTSTLSDHSDPGQPVEFADDVLEKEISERYRSFMKPLLTDLQLGLSGVTSGQVSFGVRVSRLLVASIRTENPYQYSLYVSLPVFGRSNWQTW